MPELPEVETIKNDLKRSIIGQTIESVDIYDARVLWGSNEKAFPKALSGHTIKDVTRRGKAIIISFTEGDYLVAQVKMTGYFVYGEHLKERFALKETKIVFHLSRGQFLNYNDQRLFGRLSYVKDLKEIPYLNTIGPEPFNGAFDKDWFYRELKKRAKPIKTLLMDQNFLAGIGNIYASEILFHAGIDPRTQARRLNLKRIETLYEKTRAILKEAIRLRGTSMRNYRDASGKKGRFKGKIKVYGRENEPCFVCQGHIIRIVQGGRSTFFCRRCQS